MISIVETRKTWLFLMSMQGRLQTLVFIRIDSVAKNQWRFHWNLREAFWNIRFQRIERLYSFISKSNGISTWIEISLSMLQLWQGQGSQYMHGRTNNWPLNYQTDLKIWFELRDPLIDFKEFRKFWVLFHSILATKIMDQFDVNEDRVLGRGEINLWRNHFRIVDELSQDDYRPGINGWLHWLKLKSLLYSPYHMGQVRSFIETFKDSCSIHLVVLPNRITVSGIEFNMEFQLMATEQKRSFE